MLTLLIINSITLGGLLFLLSCGFSLIFGLMKIPNLTHGSFFMLGAYVSVQLVNSTGLNFFASAIICSLFIGLIGSLFERTIIRKLSGNHQAQVLVTLGLSFVISDLCLMTWGGEAISVPTPSAIRGMTKFWMLDFPTYRIFIVLVGILTATFFYLVIEKSKFGAKIRAGVDDPDMTRAMGIPIHKLFTLTFGIGTGLAALAGIIGSPILSIYTGLDMDMLPLALVVVILGGAGSLKGSILGSLIIAILFNFGQAYLPEFAYFILFLPMVIILALKPNGLYGKFSI
jgi:branched-chain amino acid transport system permease protein